MELFFNVDSPLRHRPPCPDDSACSLFRSPDLRHVRDRRPRPGDLDPAGTDAYAAQRNRELLGSHRELRTRDRGRRPTGPALPTARSGLTGAAINGVIYVAGGYILSGGVVTQDAFEAFDVGTDSWTALQPLPQARLGLGAGAVDGRLFVFGGDTNAEVPTKTLAYDPALDNWTQLTNMPTPVNFMSVSAVGSTIYVIGGGPVNLNRFDGVDANRAFVPPNVAAVDEPGTDGTSADNPSAMITFAQNRPNPFDLGTRIDYTLASSGHVQIDILDVAGRRVTTLSGGKIGAGSHSVWWDGRDVGGNAMTPGVYFYRLALTPAGVEARSLPVVTRAQRMLLLR